MNSISITLVLVSAIFLFGGFHEQVDVKNSSKNKELNNYADQEVPGYITRDNTPAHNQLNDTVATLGRILFYDKNLSIDNTVSCANCHKQEFAFGDTAIVSKGVSQSLTERHSMRLVNIRYGEITKFFWDERASSLEEQTTQPIKDHIEMGFSGVNPNTTFSDLITKLECVEYYQELFKYAFGESEITESRIQLALAQFIRSIQSFDSKYDVGRSQVDNNNDPFPNFTEQENHGKELFMKTKVENGADCHNCHRAPLFDIDPDVSNNGIISVAGDPSAFDLTNTKSPSLRDLVNQDGRLNGPLMHDGSLSNLEAVIDHYNHIIIDPRNRTRLNSRLRNANRTKGQKLNLTEVEKEALVSFLKTLSGTSIYQDERWSDPFDLDGNLTIL